MALIEIDGLPNLKMGGCSMANCECHNQVVLGGMILQLVSDINGRFSQHSTTCFHHFPCRMGSPFDHVQLPYKWLNSMVLMGLAASMQHGKKPFLHTVCSQTIPPLDRFSSFCPAASCSQFFRQFLHSSSCIPAASTCPYILWPDTNQRGYIDFDVDSCGTLSCDHCAQEHPSPVRLHICPWRSSLPAADVGSMSRLHPSTLSNLLRSSCSNI